jgi:uncharacterized protein
MLAKLQIAMVAAMREKNTDRLTTIRMLIAEVKNESFVKGKQRPPDEVVMAYHKKLVKAKEEFASNAEFAAKTEKEIAIVEEFLPKMMSREDIILFIEENVTAVDMKTVMPLLKGKADSRLLQEIVSTWTRQG